MASEKITKFVEDIKTLSVLELSELVDAIQEEFGVTAMVAAAPAAGAAGDSDRGVPVGAHLRAAVGEVSVYHPHPGLHRGLCGHRAVCVLPDPAVAVLGAGLRRGYVPGRCAGAQPLPLCQDHPAGEVGRVFRPVRHLRQGGILPGHHDRQRGQPADRQR